MYYTAFTYSDCYSYVHTKANTDAEAASDTGTAHTHHVIKAVVDVPTRNLADVLIVGLFLVFKKILTP